MAHFDEKQLKAHLKEGVFLRAYLIFGDEDYLKQHYAMLLCEKAVDEAFRALNFDQYEGKNADLRDVFDRANTMPMMSERRCVLVDDYPLDTLNEKALKTLEESLAALPETAVVIFRQMQTGLGKNAKKLAAMFEKSGAACELNRRKGQELLKPLIASAAKRGCSLSSAAAQYLVSCVGDDFNVLIAELSKLCAYANGEITKEHIDLLAVKTLDARVYDLTRALMQHDYEKAHRVLDILLTLRTEPNFILGTIISAFVDLYRVKVALTCCGSTAPLTEVFNYKNRAFALNYTARDAAKLSLRQIRACLKELQKADLKLKTGGDNGTLILETLMVRLLLVMNGETKC